MTRWWRLTLAGLLVVAVGCTVPPDEQDVVSAPTATEPPTFVVRAGTQEVVASAWTYCLPGVCVDGTAPTDPPTIGSPGEVTVTPPRADWTLQVTFRPVGSRCGTDLEASPVRISESEWQLISVGPPGLYDVDLFASRSMSGDAVTTVRWKTTGEVGASLRPDPTPSC